MAKKYTPDQIIAARKEEKRLYDEIADTAKKIKEEQARINKLKKEDRVEAQAMLDMEKQELDMKKMEHKEVKDINTLYKRQHAIQSRLHGGAAKHIKEIITKKELEESVNRAVGYQADMSSDIYNILVETSSIRNDILKTNNKEKLLSYDIKTNSESLAEMYERIKELKQDTTKEGKKAFKDAEKEYKLANDAHLATSEVAEKMQTKNALQDKLLGTIGQSTEGMSQMKDQAILFGRALARNPVLIVLALIVGAGVAMHKLVKQTQAFRDELKVSLSQGKDLTKTLYNAENILSGKGFKEKFSGVTRRLKEGFGDMILDVDSKDSLSALVNATGNLDDATGKLGYTNVRALTEMQAAFGVMPQDAANLAKTLQGITGETYQQSLNQVVSAAAMADMNGVVSGMVISDLAENSEEIAKYTDGTASGMAKAAIQARKMGVNLSTTAKIADTLLDFESSIESEMEASLLIGKQLNYNRARALALEGDIAGAAQDVVRQIGGAGAFRQLNTLQRQALAGSVGVTVEELSRLASGKPLKIEDDPNKIQQRLNESNEWLSDEIKKGTIATVGLTAVTIQSIRLLSQMNKNRIAGLGIKTDAAVNKNLLNKAKLTTRGSVDMRTTGGKELAKRGLIDKSGQIIKATRLTRTLGAINKLSKGLGVLSLMTTTLGASDIESRKAQEDFDNQIQHLTDLGHDQTSIMKMLTTDRKDEQGNALPDIPQEYNKWFDLKFSSTDWENYENMVSKSIGFQDINRGGYMVDDPAFVQGDLFSRQKEVSPEELISMVLKEFGDLDEETRKQISIDPLSIADLALELSTLQGFGGGGLQTDKQIESGEFIELLRQIATNTGVTIPQAFENITTGVD